MKLIKETVMTSLSVCLFIGLTACSGMSTRDRDTAIGAGAGAVGGAVLTGGGGVGSGGRCMRYLAVALNNGARVLEGVCIWRSFIEIRT